MSVLLAVNGTLMRGLELCKNMEDAGAEFVQGKVGEINIIEDKNLITGQNFQSSKAFAHAVINWLDRN